MSSSAHSSVTRHQEFSSTTLTSNLKWSSESSSEIAPPPSSDGQPHNVEDSRAAYNPNQNRQQVITQSNVAEPSLPTALNSYYPIRARIHHINEGNSFLSLPPTQLHEFGLGRHQAPPSNSLASIEANHLQTPVATTNPTSLHPIAQELPRDPLVSCLANVLRPRVQVVGPPRTNEDLVHFLISEWHASPETGRDDDYQRLQQILISRYLRQARPSEQEPKSTE
mmetsp:Transcript_3320/g.6976  ORF Transcript_3320/g.6976 Transcript_3320/m.6976 type:complete len:224 (+) Transcript_3320:75-746(+)